MQDPWARLDAGLWNATYYAGGHSDPTMENLEKVPSYRPDLDERKKTLASPPQKKESLPYSRVHLRSSPLQITQISQSHHQIPTSDRCASSHDVWLPTSFPISISQGRVEWGQARIKQQEAHPLPFSEALDLGKLTPVLPQKPPSSLCPCFLYHLAFRPLACSHCLRDIMLHWNSPWPTDGYVAAFFFARAEEWDKVKW